MSNFTDFTTTASRRQTTATTAMMAAMIRRARTDPCVFVQRIRMGPGAYHPMAPLHRELQRHLSRHPRALVELPRDHGKSTQVCLRIIWELGRNPDLRVKIVCAGEAIAADRSRFLRSQIANNPLVRQVFPHLRPGSPWQAAFSVARPNTTIGPSVAAFGIGAASTGTRADLLVCDDVVDVKAIASKAHRERASDDFFNNLLNLLEPDGRFWGLSTPWHADDLNARLKRNPEFALFRKAVSADLEPIWPRRWDQHSLTKRKTEIGAAAFARGYLLTPIAEDELVIRPEWVTTYDEPPPEFERIILSVDPAMSVKAHADATALVVLGKAGNRIYCLAAVAKRLAAPGMLELIEAFDAQWKPETIVFESNGGFDAVKDLFVRHAAFGPKVKGVKQSKAKAARFAAFAVSVENGSFLVRPTQRNLIEEMTSFPFGEHDDLLDAAATGTSFLLNAPREPRMWLF